MDDSVGEEEVCVEVVGVDELEDDSSGVVVEELTVDDVEEVAVLEVEVVDVVSSFSVGVTSVEELDEDELDEELDEEELDDELVSSFARFALLRDPTRQSLCGVEHSGNSWNL